MIRREADPPTPLCLESRHHRRQKAPKGRKENNNIAPLVSSQEALIRQTSRHREGHEEYSTLHEKGRREKDSSRKKNRKQNLQKAQATKKTEGRRSTTEL